MGDSVVTIDVTLRGRVRLKAVEAIREGHERVVAMRTGMLDCQATAAHHPISGGLANLSFLLRGR